MTRAIVESYRAGFGALSPLARHAVAGTFLFVAARMGLVTFLGIHLVEGRGFDLALVGLSFLVENLARGLVGPFGGALSDRYGRPPVLVAGLVAAVVVTPLVLLVETPAHLLAWSLAMGIAQGPFYPTLVALLTDATPVRARQTVLAVNYTALSLGFTAGVAPAGFLAQLGFGWLVAFSVALYALVGALLARALRRVPPPAERAAAGGVLADASRAGRDPAFLALAALGFVFPLGIGLVALALPIYATASGVGEASLGLALSGTGLLLAALSIPVNARVAGHGPFRLLAVSALFLAASYPVFAWWPAVGGVVVGLVVFTLGETLFSAAIPTAVAALAPPHARGAYQGAWALVHAATFGLALVLTGLLEPRLGWRATWLAFAAYTLVAALWLLVARGRLRRVADARAG